MNILNYFSQIKKRIIKLDNYITNPINNKDINNPFLPGLPETYIWIEEDKSN